MIELTKKHINALDKEYGLPLYVFNQEEFVQNYRELENTFRAIYPKYHICYSYKTNYTPAICSLVKELGGYAEVVSDMEYELARRLGYGAEKIVYNGPCKGTVLEEHLLSGGINNIDRIEEAVKICEVADKHPSVTMQTGIRVNFDIDAGYTSRFGIDIDKLDQVFDLLNNHGVRINGLHCHMSRARGLEPWSLRAKEMLGLVSKYRLLDIDYISLGSGMSGHMDPELKAQFPVVPTYEEYGEAVVRQFAAYYEGKANKPILFTEPGTTLVSKYVDFIAKVEGIKEIRGKQFILCNCSFHNLGEICQMKNVPIRFFSCEAGRQDIKDANLVGYTCLEQDVLYRGYTGKIAVGDYVVFGNVGGYSLVDKPPFIQPNCAMISLNGTESKLIKRKETWDDIFGSYVL